MQNFALYSKYYDLLYKDKNYKAETDYINGLVQKHAPDCKKILELGSGTGKHAMLLADKGYRIYGIERSPEMVEIARRENHNNVRYEVNDISLFSLPEQFDVALSLFHVVSYLTDNKTLISTFQNVAHHLQKKGLFIFDVWYSPAVFLQQPETRIKRFSDDQTRVTRLAEPHIHSRENVIDVNYELIIEDKKDRSVNTFTEKHPIRHFSEPEIGLLAECTGFKVVHAEEFLTGNTPGAQTWGVCFILQKK
jgi:SAM-dependent methyltransferase